MYLREIIRSIKSRKFHSLIVILAISIGISMMTVVDNMNASLIRSVEIIDAQYATHDIIFFFNNFYPIDLLNQISQIDGVRIAEPRIYIYGSSIWKGDTLAIRLIGTPPRPKVDYIRVNDESVWERFEGNVSIVDQHTANRAGINVNDILSVITDFGFFNFKIMWLADAEWSRSIGYPIRVTLFVPISTLQDLLNVSNKANVIVIRVKSGFSIVDVYKKISEFLKSKGYEFEGYYKRHLNNLLDETISIVFGILFIPASLIAVSILSFVLFNKIANEYRLIGIRKAIGFTPNQIFLILFLEGVILYLISIPLSLIISGLMTIVFLKIFAGLVECKVVVLSAEGFLKSVVITFFFTIIGIVYPSWKARKIRALDAIRWGFERSVYTAKKKSSRLPKTFIMAWRNMMRKKKRYFSMVLALIICCSATLMTSVFCDSIANTYSNVIKSNMKFDFMVYFKKPISLNDINAVRNISGVECAEGLFSIYWDIKNISFYTK